MAKITHGFGVDIPEFCNTIDFSLSKTVEERDFARKGTMMDVHILRVMCDGMTCEASCPHCVYRAGQDQIGNDSFDFQAFEKARQFALRSGAVTLEIEAGGDPLADEWTKLYQILSEGSSDFPQVGLTTPGQGIFDSQESFLNLIGWHLTNLTLTIPHHDPKKRKTLLGLDLDYGELVGYLREECRVVVRAACFLSRQGISSSQEVLDFVNWSREVGIQQIAFREIEPPDETLNAETAQWCHENAVEVDTEENWNFDDPGRAVLYVNSLVSQNQARPVYVLPWGETVYDIDGVNVIFEKSEKNYYGKFIKSLVLSGQHVYARWESGGTIIF